MFTKLRLFPSHKHVKNTNMKTVGKRGKKRTWGLNWCFGYDRRNIPNCQVPSKSFYYSQGDFSFAIHVLSGVKCFVVFQNAGWGKKQL